MSNTGRWVASGWPLDRIAAQAAREAEEEAQRAAAAASAEETRGVKWADIFGSRMAQCTTEAVW